LIIGRDANGWVLNYWGNGLVGAAASLLTIWMAGHLRLQWGSEPSQDVKLNGND
jgi:hypothetical protein